MANVNEAAISVSRTEIIAQLEAKRDELAAEYDARIAKYQNRADSYKANKKAWKKYYTSIAKGLKNGSIEVADNGRLSNGPNARKAVPTKPKNTHSQHSEASYAKQRVQQAKQEKKTVVDTYDAKIRLLNMSTEDTVVVPMADYERLLAGNVANRRWY